MMLVGFGCGSGQHFGLDVSGVAFGKSGAQEVARRVSTLWPQASHESNSRGELSQAMDLGTWDAQESTRAGRPSHTRAMPRKYHALKVPVR